MKCNICGKELGTGDNFQFGVCCNCDTTSFLKQFQVKQPIVNTPICPKRVLLIEDGSVDLEELEKLGIEYIVYRKGSNPPYWIEIKGE